MKKYLDLSIPLHARLYIEEEWSKKRGASYVQTSSGRTLQFSDLTDSEAIEVANMLYDIQVEAERREATAKDLLQ